MLYLCLQYNHYAQTNKKYKIDRNYMSAPSKRSTSTWDGMVPIIVNDVAIPQGPARSVTAPLGPTYAIKGGGTTIPSSVWANQGTSWNTNLTDLSPGSLKVSGTAEFEGDVILQGRNLSDWLTAVESRLGMLEPNPALEQDYQQLKALGDQYRALEQKLLEQQRIFDILKNK